FQELRNAEANLVDRLVTQILLWHSKTLTAIRVVKQVGRIAYRIRPASRCLKKTRIRRPELEKDNIRQLIESRRLASEVSTLVPLGKNHPMFFFCSIDRLPPVCPPYRRLLRDKRGGQQSCENRGSGSHDPIVDFFRNDRSPRPLRTVAHGP